MVHVAEPVSDHRPVVAVKLIGRRLDRFGADGYGTLVGFVNVINVDGNTPFAAKRDHTPHEQMRV